MSRVVTISRSSSPFLQNCASLPGSVSQNYENSPESDLDLSNFIINDTSFEKQSVDIQCDDLSLLAKKHFENEGINDWSFDGNCSLADVLYVDENYSTFVRNEVSGNDTESDSLSFDLSNPLSLDCLAVDNILNNCTGDLENVLDLDFISGGSSVSQILDSIADSCLSCEKKDDNTLDKFLSKEQSHKESDATSNVNLVPDIDLSFCLKKTNSFSPPDSPSSKLTNSEFLKTDSVPVKNADHALDREFDSIKGTLNSSKKSLLFRAISAKPKLDMGKLVKLQGIRRNILK